MKVTRQPRFRPGDMVRNLLYPMIPVFGFACVWIVGVAGSLESKVNRELGPNSPTNQPIICPPAPDGPTVASIDPQE